MDEKRRILIPACCTGLDGGGAHAGAQFEARVRPPAQTWLVYNNTGIIYTMQNIVVGRDGRWGKKLRMNSEGEK